MIPMTQYKSARAEAEHTAALLRAALQRVGLPEEETARVRALVTGRGRAYVEVGALPLGSAVKLLNALPLALVMDRADDAPGLPAEASG
ncbi:hypothetical protein GCM10010121_077520 [Streptomyces brasiliensis]|uniref:Uncharacterized protein n=1 Tax=Streptomyces brasiliensis TaxID=1954 RepID=A0A917LC49_9ACTN|nr:hypothetical protein GCM10010121_077520 [Streptomyces brasiliensis]